MGEERWEWYVYARGMPGGPHYSYLKPDQARGGVVGGATHE